MISHELSQDFLYVSEIKFLQCDKSITPKDSETIFLHTSQKYEDPIDIGYAESNRKNKKAIFLNLIFVSFIIPQLSIKQFCYF